jgi:hypothetical protein
MPFLTPLTCRGKRMKAAPPNETVTLFPGSRKEEVWVSIDGHIVGRIIQRGDKFIAEPTPVSTFLPSQEKAVEFLLEFLRKGRHTSDRL